MKILETLLILIPISAMLVFGLLVAYLIAWSQDPFAFFLFVSICLLILIAVAFFTVKKIVHTWGSGCNIAIPIVIFLICAIFSFSGFF